MIDILGYVALVVIIGAVATVAAVFSAYHVGYWRGWDAAINCAIDKLDEKEWEKVFSEMREDDENV